MSTTHDALNLTMVGRRFAVMGFTNEPALIAYDCTMLVDVWHIVEVEPFRDSIAASTRRVT